MKDLNDCLERIRDSVRHQTGVYRLRTPQLELSAGKRIFERIAGFFMEGENKKYEISTLEETIELLIKWAYLQDCNLNFNKGILLKGKTGRGKTMLFKIFSKFLKIDDLAFKENGVYKVFDMKIINVKQIAGEYQNTENGGYAIIEKYGKINCLVLDDIGSEEAISSNYGNKINVVETIIDIREERGLLTFGTTNLDKFSGTYDDRTISRMNKLFNVIPINHDKDYRRL